MHPTRARLRRYLTLGVAIATFLSINNLTGSLLMAAPAQGAALRIVVIAGEGGVNIIMRNTAVAPIVEVRDRNDQPVAGALVLFTIGGNSATFSGGAQTLSVTTNALGRAVTTALKPVTAGRFQISVQASFQGQTATAAITQVNYATLAGAQAAGATGTTGAAAGAGAGATGGLSALAVSGIVAGAAAGTLVAVKAASGSSSSGSTTTTFAGALSLQFVETRTFTSGGSVSSTCTVTGVITQSLTLTLDQRSDGSVSGALKVSGNGGDIATTCPGYVLTNEPISGTAELKGTTGNFGFTDQETSTHSDPNAGTFSEATTNTISCSLSNGVVSLTFSISSHSTGISGLPPGVGFSANAAGSVQTTLH